MVCLRWIGGPTDAVQFHDVRVLQVAHLQAFANKIVQFLTIHYILGGKKKYAEKIPLHGGKPYLGRS